MKFTSLVVLLMIGQCVLTSPLFSQEVVNSDIEITGFIDVIHQYQTNRTDNTEFNVGQAELDLANEISEKAAVEVAVVYNNEAAVFELGAAILELQLFQSKSKREQNGFNITHSSIQIGQFDVPFGIDYRVYPSVDRKLITSPRVVELTHGKWNDFGLCLNAETRNGSLTLFAVNGFKSTAEVDTQVINLATGLFEDSTLEIDTSPTNAFGTRLGLTLFKNLEIGGSTAIGINADGKNEMVLLGTDFQFSSNHLFVKGEYIHHSVNRSIDRQNHQGYYFQSLYQFNRYYLVGRYGSFKPEGVEWIGQFSIGGGYTLTKGVELRLESIIHETSAQNKTLLQIAAAF